MNRKEFEKRTLNDRAYILLEYGTPVYTTKIYYYKVLIIDFSNELFELVFDERENIVVVANSISWSIMNHYLESIHLPHISGIKTH